MRAARPLRMAVDGRRLHPGFPVERMTQIYEGTNQIQRAVMARSLLG